MARTIIPAGEVKRLGDEVLKSKDEAFIREKLELIFREALTGHEKTENITLWRARLVDKDHPDGFSSVEEILAPPDEKTNHGRLNNRSQPILYTTVSNHGALAEVRAEVGARVHVTAFRLKEREELNCIMVGEVIKAHKWADGKQLQKIAEKLEKPDKLTEEQITSIFLMDALLIKILSYENAEKHDYQHTRILADIIRKKHPESDGIIYPGVESFGAKNYALNKDVFLKFDPADMYLIEITEKYFYGLYQWKCLRKFKKFQGNKIIWQDYSV